MTRADLTLLYIGGAGRSGSTLLECMLDGVPGVVGAGEVTHLWERGLLGDQLCGCGQPFSACPFWRDVLQRAWPDGLPGTPAELFDLKRRAVELPGAAFRRGARRRYVALLASLYRAVADVADARVVVDSTKYPSEAWLLRGLREHGIRVRYAHLVREPAAVVHSWQRKRRRPEISDREAFMPRYPWWKTTAAWVIFNAAFDLLGRVEKGSVRRVRYGDMVTRPAAVLDDLRRHVGLPTDALPFVRGREVTLGSNHTVSGNPSRFRTGAIALKPDAEWRERAPRWQVRAVNLVTAWQRHGYGLAGAGEE